MLTQERLKEALQYDPDTGVFIWISKPLGIKGNGIRLGSVAGSLKEDGYIRIGIDGEYFYANRLAWLYLYGEFPEAEVDHANGVRSDNRKTNLRLANIQQNRRNTKRNSLNTSGYKGVHFSKAAKKWLATIFLNGKNRHLGCFETAEVAAAAYRKAAAFHFGEFARFE